MSDAPLANASPSDPSQDAAQACACRGADARAQQRLEMLRELSQIGMRLARGVERRAEDEDAPDVGLVFARIARAVRQTLALEARLEGELAVRLRSAAVAREREEERAARAPIDERTRLVRRAVGRAIEAEASEDDAEALFEDLDERLCDREDDADFLDRPMGELVALICKDLGVTADLRLWEDEAWARAEAAARAVEAAAPTPESQPNPGGARPPPSHARPAVSPGWMSG